MVPKLFFFIQATILSTASSNCLNESFSLCDIGYLKYPFWGGTHGLECGCCGFQIICNAAAGEPLLNISSLLYKVQSHLDFSTNTLKLSRQDLIQSNACPKHLLRNTTLDPQLFRFPPSSTDRNLTLYLDCGGDGLQSLPNQYKCDKKIHLFTTADNSSGPGPGVKCKNTIVVPVNQKNAQSLEDPTASSVNILRSAIASGFSVQWLNQSDCGADVCGHRQPNASVNVPERRRGLPPVQSPGNPPQSLRDHRPPRNGSRKGKGPAKGIVIVVALTVAGVIILSITILCALRSRPTIVNTSNQESKQEVENFLLRHGSLTPKRFRYSEIKKITRSLSDKLGQGGYGSVYKGMLPDGCPVAVKVLVETSSNGEEFINEVASISRTSHVNIVALLGYCYEGNRRALVYEYMPNNSLDKFLNHDQSAGSMDCCPGLVTLFKIAVGTAKGLEYLHTGCTTRIVHFDIKPQNILLDEDFCPKIADFGLAKLCKKKQSILSVLGTRGTVGYIAPEVFSRNFGGVSHKSDVYSYGMMLLEMVGARKVAEAEANQSSENYFPDKIYEQVIIDVAQILDGLMIEEEEEVRRKMILVGFWCIQTIPSSRPSISKVVEMLEGGISSIQIPPKPFLFSPNLPRHEISSSLSVYVDRRVHGPVPGRLRFGIAGSPVLKIGTGTEP